MAKRPLVVSRGSEAERKRLTNMYTAVALGIFGHQPPEAVNVWSRPPTQCELGTASRLDAEASRRINTARAMSTHWVFLLFHFANTITNSLSHGLRAQTQPIYVTNQYAKFGAKIVN